MADTAAVQFLISNLGQLLVHHFNLVSRVDEEVKQLIKDLEYLNAFLKYASKKKIKEEIVHVFVREIRLAVYDAEDVVDAFVTQAAAKKSSTKWFSRLFKDPIKLDRIAQRVQKVRDDVKDAYGDKTKIEAALLEISGDAADKPEVPRVRQENVVGFNDEAETLIGYLKEDTPGRLDIISIVGMPGLGKSTLAGKIIRDPEIQFEFPTRLWVYVSKFTPKDVFLNILREFTTITEDLRSMHEHELANKVKGYLARGKFLIVMDDVWEPKDWEKISVALPTFNHLGKILITSRSKEVAVAANKRRDPHNLRPFKAEESWELLQYEVFGEPKCVPNVEDYGKIISQRCEGLPLSVVVIGGIIVKMLSTAVDMPGRTSVWRKVSKRVKEYIANDPELTMKRIISLSYENLPYHLRACFLYLGMFPEDMEIRAWMLFRMWIAEGFVQERTNFSLEEIAESYLDDLINRNLVKVDKRSSDGKVKTCRIHDSLREFCKNVAGRDEENFLQEIKRSENGSLEPLMNKDDKYRRLCIHSDIDKFLSSKPCGRRIRSFVCFSKEESQSENVSAILVGFKLLRVLEVKPIKFTKITPDLYDLLHLRYIHFSCDLRSLPKAFSDLWNMQTLIVDTTSPTIQVVANIWKMRHLRHFKTNATTKLPELQRVDAETENNIQTLSTISPGDCTNKVFDMVRNLKGVKICGLLKVLLGGNTNTGSFDNMVKLQKLEKLKLKNDAFPQPVCPNNKLPQLPSSEKFPPNLRMLTLSATHLEWRQMRILSSLDNLEVLKLKENAFMGDCWETVDGGFSRLNFLLISRSDLMVWKMSAHHFPTLVHLELRNCKDFQEVPDAFVEKPSLSALILNYCPIAAASAKKKFKEKKLLDPKTNRAVEFKLSIFPPVN